jgi:hypothetical protein
MLQAKDEYIETLKRIEQTEKVIELHKDNLRALGMNENQIDYSTQPIICFLEQLKEEAEQYNISGNLTLACLQDQKD